MKSEISATDAARRFSEILNRVRYRNETFVVRRGGVAVCEIVPVRGDASTLPHSDREAPGARDKQARKGLKAQKSKRRKSRAARV
jgi:antitoxin (DNA-binding transcriptional repressor) of toxin-antitoxin stability system